MTEQEEGVEAGEVIEVAEAMHGAGEGMITNLSGRRNRGITAH